MRPTARTTALCLLFTLAAVAARGQSFEPPANYYSTATGTGATLKSQLRTITSDMSGVNYGDARYSAEYTDPNPNVSGRILLIYDRASVSRVWDEAATWNREHIWPVSRLGVSAPNNSTTNISTDQFNLRPADTELNAFRGNSPFGQDSTTGGYGYQGSYFYPGDADAGDVARAQFYMATRYTQLTLTDGVPSGTQMGDLSSLVDYHFRDVPDAFERRRNHTIFGLAGENSPAITNPYAQENRNPFVDRPEFAWSIFVNQMNDSSIQLQGGAAGGNGATSLNLDLGRVIVGGALPAAQAVTLNKAGLNGTYYQVTPAGLATSSISGRYNAFATNATATKTINVGLATTTATVGLRSGTVTIDNLDVTTGGGTGRGANDGNDLVNVSLSVLNHANPSFSGVDDANSLVYDFGTVTLGAPAPTFAFDIFNLPTTIGFTAGLDLDSFNAVGNTSTLAANLTPFFGANTLPAGAGNDFSATFDTSTIGNFSATYTLAFSDENLAGATSLGTMTLTLTGVVEPAAVAESADFDSDGDVDGADFLAWQRGLGTAAATPSDGDGNDDQWVDADDLSIWSSQFGQTTISPLQAVPEPAAAWLAALAAMFLTAMSGYHQRLSTSS